MRSIAACGGLLCLALVACSSDTFTPTPADAGAGDAAVADADAGPGFCASQSPGYLICDDFDTLGDGAAGLGSAWVVTTNNGGTVLRTGATFLSPGNAFEATTRPGKSAATVYRNPNAGLATRMTLSFAIYLSGGCNEPGAGVQLPALVAADPALTRNYFISLGLSDSKLTVLEATATADAGAVGSAKVGNTSWPTDKWVRVVLDAELGAAKVARVSVDGGPPESFPLKIDLPAVTLPGVSIGASTDAGRATSCTVDYDDVMFRINGK